MLLSAIVVYKLLYSVEYQRVKQLIEKRKLCRVSKNALSKFGSVYPSTGVQNVLTKILHDLFFYRFLFQQFVGNLIGVDNRTAQLGELVGNSSLSGVNAAQYTYYGFFAGFNHGKGVFDSIPQYYVAILIPYRCVVKLNTANFSDC